MFNKQANTARNVYNALLAGGTIGAGGFEHNSTPLPERRAKLSQLKHFSPYDDDFAYTTFSNSAETIDKYKKGFKRKANFNAAKLQNILNYLEPIISGAQSVVF